MGSRICGNCPSGYKNDGDTGCEGQCRPSANSGYKDTPCIDWLDVNECLNDNGGCESTRTCTNTPGGRTCGACSSGYENDGDADCAGQSEWVDEFGGIDERGNFCSCA